ncbi:CatB-related O-acetyltransferase [Fusobacterium sp.]|uniref:CatB-related O-acetyltransferase n=1 Tax=Fusobacterium sp. TaxID=68766 RepID=UPI00262C3547|nr:CatB-related O-acetyltransferase [Fusobacterium sp.]
MFKVIRKKIKKYFEIRKYKKHEIFIKETSEIRKSKLFGKNKIGKNTLINHSEIGYASYLGDNCHIERTKIGKYVSIAQNVEVVIGNHPIHYVSTHPFSYMESLLGEIKEVKKYDNIFSYADSDFYCVIGNDVWIGANVKILNGVKIGDGAVLGMGAVITKDVPPYAIVVGVPAKIKNYRFSKEEINFLEKFKWWDRDINWIKENTKLFSDIKLFMAKYKES